MKVKRILKDAWLVEFEDVPEEYGSASIVWGTVVIDYTDKWEPGSWCSTSIVQNIEGDMVTTRNSLYQIQEHLKPIKLPLKATHLLRDGIDPHTCLELLSGRVNVLVNEEDFKL